MDDDIAVVGIGCRFPGADNIDEYWRVLINGENHVLEIPPERWNNDAFYSEDKDEPGKHYVKRAGFISRHDEWDNKLFQVSENEATRIDPQQRHVLECMHMAMEDGGITRKDLNGSQTGVYIGVMNDDYKVIASSDHNDDTNYSATGMSTTIIASRVSFVYNLQGPCMVIDTACSSSMVAVHLGCQAIRSGDCEMAVCGGVSSIISPDTFMALCKARMMSPTGQCQTFCNTADGYARGEGCGVVILKSFKKALSDGNKIWGVVKTGSNQDGRVSQPITAPSGEQQEELLKKVYKQYNVDPTSLQYIEVHGTGTPIGDPTEVNALGRFISSYREKKQRIPSLKFENNEKALKVDSGHPSETESSDNEIDRLSDTGSIDLGKLSDNDKTDSARLSDSDSTEQVFPAADSDNDEEKENGSSRKQQFINGIIPIGSVKTNIGHTESAAGVAALIKVLLMMKNGKIVPSLHVKKDKSNLNKKIKLDEYGLDIALDVTDWMPNDEGDRICCVNCFGFGGSNSHAIVLQNTKFLQTKLPPPDTDSIYKVLCLSAVDKRSLKNTIDIMDECLTHGDNSLHDVAYTAAYHRDHFSSRTIVFGKDQDEIQQQLKLKAKTVDKLETAAKVRKIFVFCGVGTTWTGMCRQMIETQPVFKNVICAIDKYLEPLAGWSMAEKFQRETDYSDPFLNHIAIFCTQVGLYAMWKHWGIIPDAIVGQSVGEVAAAYASGALSLKDAVDVIYYRSKILAEMTGGKMMVAGNLPVETIEEICESYDNKVTVAVYNSPTSCTLSGDADVMEKIKADLEKRNEKEKADIMIRPLSVQCAYHSYHVESCMSVIEKQLNHIQGCKVFVEHFSTVTGALGAEDDFITGKYWAENIRKPVRFMHALLEASSDGVTNVFVEIGPRQVLRAHLQSIMGETIKGICVPSMNSNKECVSMYSSMSTLYELGADFEWQNIIFPHGNALAVPRYGFNKTKFLYIPETSQLMLSGITNRTEAHMYVRNNSSNTAEYRILIDKETTPFVYDHYFLNAILVPGATYVEAAFECGQRKSELNAYELSVSTEFVKPFTPPDEKQYQIDFEMTEDHEIHGHRYVAKRDNRTMCFGTIKRRTDTERPKVDIKAIQSRCKTYKNREESYACLDRIDFNYGESLSLIEQSWSSATECVVEFVVPDDVKVQSKSTHLHPSIIDGMFQTFGILSTIGAEGPTLPKGLSSIVINRPPQGRMFGFSQMVRATPIGNHYNSMLLSPDGHVIAEIQNFYTKTMRISDAPNQSIVYNVTWNRVPNQKDLLEINEESEKQRGKLVIVGTKRFINCYRYAENDNAVSYELNDNLQDTEAVYKLIADQVPSMRAIVFAPCHHVQNVMNANKSVYNTTKYNFFALSLLIRVLRESNYSIPIFVVTENVRAAPSLKISATNVCGGELWGMVRSAMAETAYNDLRLVDMSMTDENVIALDAITRNPTINYSEYLIDNGTMYYNEMIEDPDQDVEPNQREIDYEPQEDLVLKSTNPAVVTSPHYQFRTKKSLSEEITSSCKIRLQSICLHDSNLYPTSTVSEDAENTYWPEIDDNGFEVVCLEGYGWLEEKNKNAKRLMEKTPKLGFCYPTDVSTVVTVPSKCTFDTTCLPSYIPGMMTVGVLLWNVVEVSKQSTTVYVIADDDDGIWIQLLRNMFSKYKKILLTVTTKEKVEDSEYTSMSAQTVIILSTITNKHVELLRNKFSSIQQIVSIEEYFPKFMQRWVQHNIKGLSLCIMNTEKLFNHSELIDKVPRVYSWIKSLDSSFKNSLAQYMEENCEEETNLSLFSLPYPKLTLHCGRNSDNYIPLKVFRTEIFRKNGCYILIGGLTGLGWELVQIMAELGAGFIATVSRRAPTEEKLTEIENIQKRYNCKIIPLQADITDIKSLKNSLHELQSRIGEAQIKGVFHGGGVINDMLLANMTQEDAEKALLPKVLGTWNLHLATVDMPLDFFVMHSSIVSILGNPGQCNYSAGNSFQDTFAHYRRSLGMCATSINWSTLSLGMATGNEEVEKSFRSQGFFYLSAEDVRACFLRAVMTNPPQVTFGIFDWSRLEFHPTVKSYPFKFAGLLDKYGTKAGGFRKTDSKYHFDFEEFNKLELNAKKAILIDLLKTMIADVFVVDNGTLDEESRFVSLGIDSMAAMSFANSIFETTQVRIPVVTLLSDSTTLRSLTAYIIENIGNGTGGGEALEPAQREDNRKILEFLQGSVTFMQKSLLKDYLENPYSRNLSRQADFEVIGLKLKPKDWKVMLNHLLKMNPELRKIYKINKEESTFESILLPEDQCEIEMEQVPFDSICNTNNTDDRAKVHFDLTKDLPIRFQIACKKTTTRMRMFIHSVISDLAGVAMIFRDVGSYMKPYVCNEDLPEKDTSIVPAEAVRTALSPRMPDMRQYWRLQLAQDIVPFTFGSDIEKKLDEANWYQISEDMPQDLVNELLNHIKARGISLYNFVITVYMVFLHQKTKLDLIPLVTNVDMRGHVPQLKSMVTRCINAMPVIGDCRNMGKVGAYIKRSSDRLHHMTQQSGYPYALIEEEMKSEELRKHVGRHRLVMDNLAHLNQTFKHKRVIVKLFNVHHSRYVYETTLYIAYDLEQNKIALEYGYNSEALTHEDASLVPGRMMELIKAFIDHQDVDVNDIVEGNVITTKFPHSVKSSVHSEKTPKEHHKKSVVNEQTHIVNGKQSKERKSSKLQELKRRLSTDPSYTVKIPGNNLVILREDCFIKQTSQGWDHEVQVSIALDTSMKNNGELILQWGDSNSKYRRYMQIETISEVAVKRLNGMYHVLLKSSNKWFVLKTASQSLATDWLATLKHAVEDKRSFHREHGPFVHHL